MIGVMTVYHHWNHRRIQRYLAGSGVETTVPAGVVSKRGVMDLDLQRTTYRDGEYR